MNKLHAAMLAHKTSELGTITGDSVVLKPTLDEGTGFLKAPVTLARVGIQQYMGYELGLVDRALDKIGVFRPPEEVFNADSLSSFENMVVTDDHPSVPVTVDNVKELQGGQVSNISSSADSVSGLATITDKELIKKIQDGKVEVSVGYSHDLKKESGVYKGETYEYIQTDIRGNHLAVVQAGRCGSACKITTDDKGGTQMLITIDGVDYETDNKQLAQAVAKLQASKDAEEANFEEKMKKVEEEKMDAEKAKDKAEAEKEVMAKDAITDDVLAGLVSERAKLIADASLIIGKDAMPECGCPNKIMDAVIKHVFPTISMDGKSVDYVTATYDLAIAKAGKAKHSLDSLQDDFSSDKDEITRDSARNKYMADMGLTVEGN